MITRANRVRTQEQAVAKDKKKKKKKNKKSGKPAEGAAIVGKRLIELTRNPLVADVVAATLVAAAAALRDNKKAHQLAAGAEKELEALARKGGQTGSALWQLALDVGRKSLEALGEAGNAPAKPKARNQAGKAARAKAPASNPSSAKPAKAKKKKRPFQDNSEGRLATVPAP